MLEEIINKYESFHDATIEKISYHRALKEDKSEIIILMNVMNVKSLELEQIEFRFIDIESFRLIESFPYSSLIITCAIFQKVDNHIVADFFPDIYKDKVLVNEESDLIIKCNKIKYKSINN